MKKLILLNLILLLCLNTLLASSSNSTLAQRSISRYVESIIEEQPEKTNIPDNSLTSTYQMNLEKVEMMKQMSGVDYSQARVGLVKSADNTRELLSALRYRNRNTIPVTSVSEIKEKQNVKIPVPAENKTVTITEISRSDRIAQLKDKYTRNVTENTIVIPKTAEKNVISKKLPQIEISNRNSSLDNTEISLEKQVEAIIESSQPSNSIIHTEPLSLYKPVKKMEDRKSNSSAQETIVDSILPAKLPSVSQPSYFSKTKEGYTEKILPVEHVYLNENETITTNEKTFDPFRLTFPTAFLPKKKTLNFTYVFGNVTGKVIDKTLSQTIFNSESSSHGLFTSYSLTDTIQLIAGYSVSESSNRIIVRTGPSYYDAFKNLISTVVDNVIQSATQRALYKSFADNVTPSRRIRNYTLGINCKVKNWNKSSLNIGIIDRKQKYSTKGIGYYVDKNTNGGDVIIPLPETIPYSLLDAFKEIDTADVYINYSNKLSDSFKFHTGLKFRRTLFSILNENNAESKDVFLPYLGLDLKLTGNIIGKAGYSKDEQSAELVVHSSPDFFYSIYYSKESLPLRTEWPTFIGSTAVPNQLAQTSLEQQSEISGITLNQKF